MQILAIDIGVKNFSFCVIEVSNDHMLFRILDWQNVNLLSMVMGDQIKSIPMTKLPSHFLIEIVVKYLITKFPRNDVVHKYSHIAIESQWAGRSNGTSKMKELAAAVYTFFISMIQVQELCCPRFPVVRMIDPKSKFNMKHIFGLSMHERGDWPTLTEHRTYLDRKGYSVRMVTYILRHREDFRLSINDEAGKMFFNSKKRDDLCDSLLLAAAMIQTMC